MSKIEEHWLESFVPMSGTGFVDVGANVCAWSKWLSPGYKFVHAVEPFKDAILAAGALPPNVTVHVMGAWSKDAMVHFGIYEPAKLLFAQEDISSYFADIGTNAPAGPGSLVLPCKTLDSMIPEKDQISLLKIDTEGAELQVLLGAPEIIHQSRPYMIIEIHSKKNAPKIIEILSKENYSIETVRSPFYDGNNPGHRPHWENHYWMICRQS
jgi:FkbM family methyltransferase